MDFKKKLYPNRVNPLIITPSRPLPKEAAIIGSGTIGPDIGYYLKSAIPGLKLFIIDVVEAPLQAAKKRIQSYLNKAVQKKRLSESRAQAILENLVFTTDYTQIKNCELVIEAATENVDLKKKIFQQVEAIVPKDTIITSNTSSLPADRIFSKVKIPERTTVTHFFAPAWKNPCVEVITWEKANQDVVDYLVWMFCKTGKAPIVSDNAISFILDRIFDNWCNESAYLLEDATASQIDKTASEFVFAGPFFVLNLANGNPIVVETNTLQMEEGAHYKPAAIFKSVDRWKTIKMGEAFDVPEKIKGKVRDRLLGILFSQSFDILDRGIGLPEDLNLGVTMALGFKKGGLDLMRDMGEAESLRIIKRFQKERPGFPGPKQPFDVYQDFNRHILVDEMDGVKIITIRRPQFLNALNDEVNEEIRQTIAADADNPAVKGFVITGYGDKAFCSGAEIGNFPKMLGDHAAAVKYAEECSTLFTYLDRMEKPVVAAVNGVALGGGFELALRCHRIVATRNASFQFPEITLGILPGIGGCIIPYRRWPQSSAVFHDMIRFGKALSAEEAHGIGMVSAVCDDYAKLIKTAVAEVNALEGPIERIADGEVKIAPIKPTEAPMAGKLPLSREVIEIIDKTITRGAAAQTLAEALKIGYEGFGTTACTDAAREGICAFQEGRTPVFDKELQKGT